MGATGTGALRVVSEPNCGNAPRHEILRRFAVAPATCDAGELGALLSEGVSWDLLGEAVYNGIPAVLDRASHHPDAVEMCVRSVITHGREASIDGELVTAGGQRVSFCHVLRFPGAAKTARVTTIRTYRAEAS